MQRKFLSDLNVSSDAESRISLVLDRVESGTDKILESPITNTVSASDILSKWDEIFSSNLYNMNETLRDLESNQRSKYGPRSIAVPWSDRKEGVKSYFEQVDDSYVTLNPESTRRLRPLSLDKAVQYLKSSTNSGLPFMVKKGNVKSETVSNFKDLLERRDPCMMFTRTQESKKTRTVWGYPIADTLNEMRYYRPLLDYQKKLSWRAALRSPRDLDESITRLIDASNLLDSVCISLDIEQFDASVSYGKQASAFEYISNLFQDSFPIKEDLNYILERFNTIGLITPDQVLTGPHGIPSGSTFTNEVGSIVQYSVGKSLSEAYLSSISQVQGDDGAYSSRDPEGFISDFKTYGLNINETKSYLSKEFIIYLQFLFHVDYRQRDGIIGGIYPIYRALNRIVYMERFDDISKDDISGKDYFAIRTLSILENCKHHPLFYEFVKFMYNIDKYNLNVSDAGLASYVRMKAKQEGKDVTFSNYSYGDDVKGLKAFESYKIVKELNG